MKLDILTVLYAVSFFQDVRLSEQPLTRGGCDR
jgi:hypothetical protein